MNTTPAAGDRRVIGSARPPTAGFSPARPTLRTRQHEALMTIPTTPTPTTRLHDVGQSLWLDNITRGLLTSGTLRRYIEEWSVTGLTSNPTIFDRAIESSHFYDDAIRRK